MILDYAPLTYTPQQNRSALEKFFMVSTYSIPIIVIVIFVFVGFSTLLYPGEFLADGTKLGDSAELITFFLIAFWMIAALTFFFRYEVAHRHERIDRFAASNGLKKLSKAEFMASLPSSFGESPPEALGPGYVFKLDDKAKTNINVLEYDHIVYKQKSNEQGVNYATVATFYSDHEFPHVFLDSKKNGELFAYKNSQRIHLEGNFSDHYNVYAPGMANIELREILTPDVMQALIDTGSDYDIEIEGKKITVFCPGQWFEAEALPRLLAFVEAVKKDIAHESVEWEAVTAVAQNSPTFTDAIKLRRGKYAVWVISLTIGSIIAIIMAVFLIQPLLPNP